MPTKDLRPLLKARFEPGSQHTDESLPAFESFLPRKADESTVTYAGRLHAAGLARVCTSEHMRDLAGFRQLSDDAYDLGCPVLVLTGELADMSEPLTGPKMLSDVLNRDGTLVVRPVLDASRVTVTPEAISPEVIVEPKWNKVERRQPITE